MARRNDLFAVFQNEIGDNLTNDTDDILNAKNKFKDLGYYKDPIVSGYIDKPLIDSIRDYQRDNGLQVDGRINPGGETEATIFGDFFRLPKPTIKDDDYDFTIKNPRNIPSLFTHGNLSSNFVAAIPAAVPWIIRGIPRVITAGRKAKEQWDIWRSVPADTRQDEVDRMCEEQFEEDYAQCMRDYKDPEQQRICIKSAMERRGKCVHDKSIDDLPPLQ